MATYYVDGAVGDNGNAGTSEGAGNAWATIVYAATQVSAGDTVYIKSSATYSGTVVLSTHGTAANPIYWVGYDSTIADGGQATIDNGGSNLSAWSGAYNYQHFRNIISTNTGTAHIWNMTTANYCAWLNCEASDCTGYGIYANDYCILDRCYIHDIMGSVSIGMVLDNETRVLNTIVHDTRYYGIYLRQEKELVYNCLVYNTNNYCIYMKYGGIALNNTCIGNGAGTGIQAGGSAGSRHGVVENNIIYDCATGIGCWSDNLHLRMGANNLLYSNTADYDANWPAHAKTTDVTGVDPLFTDAGSDDYTLSAASPARNAGRDVLGAANGMDIGAYQSIDAGSRIIITG